MKHLLWLCLVLAAVALLAGCVEHRVYVHGPPVALRPGNVVVSSPPPAPQREVIIGSPGPAYVYVPGYWAWRGRWVWMGGTWVARPHGRTAWEPGHWVHRGHGYVWIGGYWR